ncbi:MAG: polyprenyl synthetase family protein [Candidatus Marsarchaeota archaeon]|jgi:geranylgeranyl diphosphate synthase type II|nr:polyprenyl synthetase family protein [Candidatus Marsarchaeota archaeon]MCL5111317.1 polyprenyl synthetase family protein [Candidatus Marsarchaeota archaeon]
MQMEEMTRFEDFSLEYRDRVYKQLLGYLPVVDDPVYNRMIKVYTERKGNYRRPSYLLLWTALYGGSIEEAVLPAAAQQASEDWMLIHDDIMDGNPVRRGRPAAHVIYGLPKAINAGDGLHAAMWKMAIDAAYSLGGSRGRRYLNKVYDVIITTHIGEHFDASLTADVKDITKFTIEDYYKSIHAKSAYYSIYGPMQLGAIIANESEETISRIPNYGTPAGLAFQITDDILDCTSTEAVLGKSIGNDVREGAKTLILYHAVQNASLGDLQRLKEIYSKSRKQKTEDEVEFVLGKFVELGSIDFSRREAQRLIEEAAKQFEIETHDMPESMVKKLARLAIGHTVERSK